MAVKDSLQREDESDGEEDGEDLSQHVCEGNSDQGCSFRVVPSSPCRRGEDRVVQLRFVL